MFLPKLPSPSPPPSSATQQPADTSTQEFSGGHWPKALAHVDSAQAACRDTFRGGIPLSPRLSSLPAARPPPPLHTLLLLLLGSKAATFVRLPSTRLVATAL